jgi:hypothetical protein
MEQRMLRLGDIVDDYCPRERRVTNHAIVAIVENAIRQTRCATCQAEHEYKEAKVSKKKTKSSDLAGGVLVTPKTGAPNGVDADQTPEAAPQADGDSRELQDSQPAPGQPVQDESNGDGSQQPHDGLPEGWLAHRPLIRATLPRTDNDPPPPRAIPEFTMHQRHGRGFGGRGGFRHGHGLSGGGGHRNGSPQSNGNEPDGNRAPQPGRPGGPGGGGGRRRRRRRPR